MKNLVFIFLVLFSLTAANAQENNEKTKSELKAEKKAQKMEDIKFMLETQSFSFEAMQIVKRDKSIVSLMDYYLVKVENEQITTYIPYYNPAVENQLEIENSPFNFTRPITEYVLEENEGDFTLRIETNNNEATFFFNFQISKYGHATLKVSSSNRRCISFKGMISKTDEFQAAN